MPCQSEFKLTHYRRERIVQDGMWCLLYSYPDLNRLDIQRVGFDAYIGYVADTLGRDKNDLP